MMRPSLLLLLAVSAVPTLAGLFAAVSFGLDAAAMTRVVQTPGVGLSIASSIWTGGIATVISLALAHAAVALAASGGWRRRLDAMALPLLAMPHLAIGIGLALVLAPSGVLLRLLSPWATGFELPPDWLIVRDPAGASLMMGLVLKETCFLIMALAAALAQVPADRLTVQARTLGYGALKGWLVVVTPLLQQQIRLPLAAVLVFGITNVEMAIPLGPGLPPTFSVMLWQWFRDPDPAIHAQAYAGTLVLLSVTLVVIAMASGLSLAGTALLKRSAESGRRRLRDRPYRAVLQGLLALGWGLGALSVLAIALRASAGAWRFPALLPAQDTTAIWREAGSSIAGVAPATLSLALATALVGIALVLPAAEASKLSERTRTRIGNWLFLPLLMPQMTFLFGVQVLLVKLDVDGTYPAVLWSHLIFALPYLWGIMAPARAAIDPRYDDVAATLGASRCAAWLTITAPLLLRSGLLAAALGFSVSVALYLPTLFAGAGRITTAATEAAAAAGSGNLRLASTHAILLALLPLVAYALAYAGSALLFRHRRSVPR